MCARQTKCAVQFRLTVCFLMVADVVIDFLCARERIPYGADRTVLQFQMLSPAGKLFMNSSYRIIQPYQVSGTVTDQLCGKASSVSSSVGFSFQSLRIRVFCSYSRLNSVSSAAYFGRIWEIAWSIILLRI